MSDAMYEAARRTGNNRLILQDIEAYKAAQQLGVEAEQLARIERDTLDLARRLGSKGLAQTQAPLSTESEALRIKH